MVNKYVLLHIFIPTITKIFFAGAFGARDRLDPPFIYVKVKLLYRPPLCLSDLSSGGALADLILSVNQQSTVLSCHRRPTIPKIFFARAYGAREPLKYFLRRKKNTFWRALSSEFVNARSWSFPLHKTLVEVQFLPVGNWENVVFRTFSWN